MLLNNQKYFTQPTVINLHRNGYTQEFHYYHLWLNYIDVLRVVIFLKTYRIKYVFQIKNRFKSWCVQLDFQIK